MKKTLILLMIVLMTSCSYTGNTENTDKIGNNENIEANKTNIDNSKEQIQQEINTTVPIKQSIVNPEGKTIYERFNLPEGFERVKAPAGSYADYLRTLPLKPHGSKVHYYNGGEKYGDVYDAVIDIDVGDRDLQQCADAVMRLRAEYLYKKGQYDKIHFDFTNGFRADYKKWIEGYRINVQGNDVKWVKRSRHSKDYSVFRNYMDMVFAYAGTISLDKEMKAVPLSDIKIGDIFLQSDPGHCVIIVDIAENKKSGEKLFMIAQSYMPAQDIHILKNEADESISPWYSINFGDTLYTPEWTFYKDDLKRFEE
jgi:hypothetical protein